MSQSFRIVPRGPYSLEASSSFLCGFTPMAGTSSARTTDGRLVLGFLDDTTYQPVTVALSQDESRNVAVEVIGASGADAISAQVARILSLDHDGALLREVGARDPVVARASEAAPGFRPVCFPSPYEAAVWGVLAQRIPMKVASKIKQRLAEATGAIAEGFGRTFCPSPAPEKLLALSALPGLPDEKLVRLKGVALAALDGKLQASRLRAMSYEDAHADLCSLRGVGAWTADHILVRGTGLADVTPTSEPRVLRAIEEAYGLPSTPSPKEALAISEGWRPLRTWITVLLVWRLGQSGGWNAVSRRARERPRAARQSPPTC